MSWFNAAKPDDVHLKARHLLQAAVLGLLCLCVAGCSIQPVYGSFGGSTSIEKRLQGIEVAPVSDRIGHYVVNDLLFRLNGTGSTVPSRYKLVIKLNETMQAPTTDTVTSRATSATIITDATYELIPVGGGPAVLNGTASSVASYDRFSQRLSNVRAARDAEIRDAKELSDQIFDQLRVSFLEKGL